MRLRAATRGSALARWQAEHVAALLAEAHGGAVEVELVIVSTEGDRRTDVPIEQVGGRGVFVKEVQAAVLDGRADIAVHSAKDLPSAPSLQPPGLVIAAVPERGDARDCLVGSTLERLPTGGVVATGSVRRRAQLANLRPDLTFAGLRGNIDSRLAKAGRFDAIVMAATALQRLGHPEVMAEVLDPILMVPQVGQGALAVECRADDEAVLEALAAVEHRPSRRRLDAERAFLAELGGGCDLPVGAYATSDDDGAEAVSAEAVRAEAGGGGGEMRVDGLVASFDGRICLRRSVSGRDPATLGRLLATDLLDGAGARSLLA